MKKRIFIIIIIVLYFACQKNDQISATNSIDINKFFSMETDEKVNYINNLNNEEKGEFLKLFLPGAVFKCSPNVMIKFLGNGEIIIQSVGHSIKDFQIAYWKIDNNKLNIWKIKEELPFPEHKNEIWENLHVKEGKNPFPERIYFYYSLKDNYNKFRIYINHNENDIAFETYEDYLKKKK